MEDTLLPYEAKELLKQIKFIGYCKEGKKISFSLKRYTNANDLSFENFMRNYIYYETSEKCMKVIDDLITSVSEFIKVEGNSEILTLFSTSLKDMRVGLENLSKTYENEPSVLSSISVNIEQIDLLLKKIELKINSN